MITGQKGILSSRQAQFQIVDIVATMRPLTKASRQIVSASTIPTVVREAFRLAQEERPGPVHLELPEDIAAEDGGDANLISPHDLELPVASATALDRAATRQESRHPAVRRKFASPARRQRTTRHAGLHRTIEDVDDFAHPLPAQPHQPGEIFQKFCPPAF
jgi:acetolactate synthase-1/2/3 large subunit